MPIHFPESLYAGRTLAKVRIQESEKALRSTFPLLVAANLFRFKELVRHSDDGWKIAECEAVAEDSVEDASLGPWSGRDDTF